MKRTLPVLRIVIVWVATALTLLLLPWSARAQQQKMECTDDSSPCASGGPCPLLNFPDEQFITAPPSDQAL